MSNDNKNTATQLLEKLFECGLSDSVENEIRQWFFEPGSRKRKDEALRQMWDRYVVINPHYDEQTYQRYVALCNRIGVSPVQDRDETAPKTGNRVRRRLNTIRISVAAAAMIAVAGIWGYNIMLDRSETGMIAGVEAQDTTVVETGNDAPTRIVMDCGSEVLLKENSRLSYVKGLNGPRTVKLEGEALFSVTKDETRPFTVTTNTLAVTVHGTEFLVTDAPHDTHATVSLYSGSVSLQSGAERIMLTPGQVFAIHKESGEWDIKSVDGDRSQQDDESIVPITLEHITVDIEKMFGLKVVNLHSELAGLEYYFTITEDMTIEEVMNILVRITDDLEYRIDGDTITIY